MTDRELAQAVAAAAALAAQARAHWEARRAVDDQAEADAALVVLRLAVPLTRSLEHWIQDRACRAALARN